MTRLLSSRKINLSPIFLLRTKRHALALVLEKIADVLFFLALTGMVASGFIMVYTVW